MIEGTNIAFLLILIFWFGTDNEYLGGGGGLRVEAVKDDIDKLE